MKKQYQFLILIVIIALGSCVSNKKINYVQSEYDLYGPAPKDSVLSSYEVPVDPYRLQHEDAISIQISSLTPEEYDFFSLGLPDDNMMMGGMQNMGSLRGYLIDEEGNIEFPVVGKVYLKGLTIYEAEKKIQDIATEYLEEPVVRVRVMNYRYTMLGEVRREGTYNVFNNRISILEAIGNSGGMGELADRSNVKVIRQYGELAKVHYVNLLDDNLIESPFYYLHQNDIIIVPPLRQRPFRNYFAENLGLIVSSLSLLLLVLNLLNTN
ncbi:MAG TPA: polysaccharide export protein [Cytophagales bacterium]|nr:polysaccharide export protein [Cytophagales bacterium]